jgi:hypothetical protein
LIDFRFQIPDFRRLMYWIDVVDQVCFIVLLFSCQVCRKLAVAHHRLE